jgi:hypothetical protein
MRIAARSLIGVGKVRALEGRTDEALESLADGMELASNLGHQDILLDGASILNDLIPDGPVSDRLLRLLRASHDAAVELDAREIAGSLALRLSE